MENLELNFKIGPIPRGPYSATTLYAMNDNVQTETGIYGSRKDGNVGHPVTDTEWWSLLVDLSAVKNATDACQDVTEEAEAAELARVAAENARALAEAARAAAETSRGNAEASRESAETSRTTAETARASAENSRESAEDVRSAAETSRVQAETGRAQAENARSAEFAELKAASQEASADALEAAGTANTAAAAADAAREGIQEDLDGKVDKVAGKGLSSEDYTAAEKGKVANVPADTNAAIAAAVAGKQNTLIAGENITIAADGKTISASGEPAAYIKDASVSADAKSLTLTKKDNTQVVFTPQGGEGAVKYNEAQDLTPEQQAQARENIDAPNKDGFYEQMGVGYAKSLLGNGAATQETIDFRPSGGTKDIGTGVATIKALKGNTIVVNQKVLQQTETATSNGITFTKTADGRIVANGTATGTALFNVQLIKIIIGHKYYKRGCPKGGGGQTFSYGDGNGSNTGSDTGNGVFSTPVLESSALNIVVRTGFVANNLTFTPVLYDLTQMFGAGNEPSTTDDPRIKWLESFGYIPYNEGTLLNFKGTGLKTTGVNQFDGMKAQVIGGTAYRILGTYATLKFAETVDGTQTDITPASGLYTPEKNGYIFATGVSNEFQIAIEHSGGDIPNTYHPYEEHTLALPITSLKADGVTIFPDGMKSAGTAKDELYGNSLGVITKAKKACGVRAYQSGDESDATLVTDGTNTIYPLDTPIEYTLDTPINTTTYVNDWGTEEVLPQGVDAQGLPATTPLNAEIVYAPNVQDAIRNLPKNYIGKESMDAILEAFKTAGIIASFSLTFDATSGKYNCSITKPTE